MSRLHPGSTRGRPPPSINVHAHAPSCLVCECALEYLMAFPRVDFKAATARLFTLDCRFVGYAATEETAQDVAAVRRSAAHPARPPLV